MHNFEWNTSMQRNTHSRGWCIKFATGLNTIIGIVQKVYEWPDCYFAKDYSWVHNRRVYSFIWHPRNMKKETDTKRDKSI